MKILIDVYDVHNKIKYEKVIDIESNALGQDLIDVLTLAVKKGCQKVVIFLHDR